MGDKGKLELFFKLYDRTYGLETLFKLGLADILSNSCKYILAFALVFLLTKFTVMSYQLQKKKQSIKSVTLRKNCPVQIYRFLLAFFTDRTHCLLILQFCEISTSNIFLCSYGQNCTPNIILSDDIFFPKCFLSFKKIEVQCFHQSFSNAKSCPMLHLAPEILTLLHAFVSSAKRPTQQTDYIEQDLVQSLLVHHL